MTFSTNAAESEGGVCLNCATSIKPSSIQELVQFGCDTEKMAQECQSWFKENSEDIKYAKDCGAPTAEQPTWWKACKDAGIENWTEILELLTHSANAIEACDNNMDCKLKLAKEAFFACKNIDGSTQYPCVDPKQLEEVYAGDLARKRDKVHSLALQDKAYREQIEKSGYEMPKGDGKGFDFSASVLKKIAEVKMKELGVKYSCYNSAGYAHMACYAIASVIDPTIVMAAPGIVLKGGKWASYALKAKSSTKVSRAGIFTKEIKTTEVIGEKLKPASISENPQVAAWQLREVGDTAAANKIEQKLAVDFETSKVVRSKKIESSTNGAQLITLENGMQGVWKENLYSKGNYELASYNIDKHLGLNSVPLTIKKKLGDKDGTLQFFVPSTKKVPQLEYLENPDFFLLQDYLTHNRDRHVENYFYHEGRPIAIDNGLAFNERHGPAPNFPKRVKDIIESKKNIDKKIAATTDEINKSKGLFKGQKLKDLEAQLRFLKSRRQILISDVGGLGITKEAAEKLEKTSIAEWNQITKDLSPSERNEFLSRKDKAVLAIKEARGELGENIFPIGPHSPWDAIRNGPDE